MPRKNTEPRCSSCCQTAVRAVTVVLCAVALGFSIGACFLPFFGKDLAAIADSQSDAISREDLSYMSTARGNHISGAAFPSTVLVDGASRFTMTLFDLRIHYDNGSDDTTDGPEVIALRSGYYYCRNGQTRIQIAEAFAVVACILCCANFLMAIALFIIPTVVRAPLAVYCVLALGCGVVAVALMADSYTTAWCGNTTEADSAAMQAYGDTTIKFGQSLSLKDDGWAISAAGFAFCAVSGVASLAAALTAAIGG